MFYLDILLSCSFVPSLAGMKSYKVRSIKDAYIPNLAEVRGQLKGIIILGTQLWSVFLPVCSPLSNESVSYIATVLFFLPLVKLKKKRTFSVCILDLATYHTVQGYLAQPTNTLQHYNTGTSFACSYTANMECLPGDHKLSISDFYDCTRPTHSN